MNANLNVQETDNAIDRNGGFVWNRLHSEREDICEALLKPQAGFAATSKADALDTGNWHRDLLQARRLMAGTYGNCAKCSRWIEDTKLDFDPAIAFCLDCWQRMQTRESRERLQVRASGDCGISLNV